MKKKNLFSVLILLVCFVLVLTLIGCNKTKPDKPDSGKPVIAEKFTITFDSDGGTQVAPVTVESGKTVTAPNEPTKEGYTFAGWYLGESTTAYDFKTIITANITLTAKWTSNNYEVTLNKDGGTCADLASYVYGVGATLPIPTKTGYTFAGWFNNSELSGEAVTAITATDTGAKTYYAKWTANKYTVTFNSNGGTEIPNAEVTYNENYGELPVPVKDGYTFGGWFTSDTYTEQILDNGVYPIAEDITLYAKWLHYQRIDVNGTLNASGEYILFGEYPQTKVTDEAIISALGDYDANSWTSYGYYINGNADDYMQYIDKEYNGVKYRGVYFTEYRPYYCNEISSPEKSNQDDNGYNLSTVYWFKYEPIKWRILNENGGKALILCDMVIDSQQYDYKNDGSYKNNYAESTIRTWLNETFYNTAFNDMQKKLIQTTEVDNSVASTGYEENQFACENTNDKVFLLSYAELTNDAYGFNSDKTVYDEERQKKSTDYAKSQGCYQNTDSENPDNPYEGNCVLWLRSPFYHYDYYARIVSSNGSVGFDDFVYTASRGVLPALEISFG